jgi:hypothetical protein
VVRILKEHKIVSLTGESSCLAGQILGLRQVLGQHGRLGGLAGAVEALENDKHASLGLLRLD